jgi:hypothetical protein
MCAKINFSKAGRRPEVPLDGRNGVGDKLRMADAYRRMNQTARKNDHNH